MLQLERMSDTDRELQTLQRVKPKFVKVNREIRPELESGRRPTGTHPCDFGDDQVRKVAKEFVGFEKMEEVFRHPCSHTGIEEVSPRV